VECFSDVEIQALINNNQLDMLLERNATTNETNQTNATDNLTNPNPNPVEKVYVRFAMESQLKKKKLYEMIDELFSLNEMDGRESILKPPNDVLVIITNSGDENGAIINLLLQIWDEHHIMVIIHNIKSLMFNILDHKDIPPHRILSEQEKLHVQQLHTITSDDELPEIGRFDPVAKAIGIIPGQVCEIIRPSETNIQSKYYRLCVNKMEDKK
jgi:DNA-directed RNA polymerase subunit H (RpoH/RPB5)